MVRSPLSPLLAAIVGALPAAAAERVSVRLGDLVLAYDPDRWEVIRLPARDGLPTGAGTIRFVCIAPECRDRPSAWAAAEPAGADGAPDCPPDGGDDDRDVRLLDPVPANGPLSLTRWIAFSNCRALTPAAVGACGRLDGLVYSFGTGTTFGCSGIDGVPGEAFAELLGGLRRPDPAAATGTP